MYPTGYAQEVFYKGGNQMKSLALAKPELTASLSLFFFLTTHQRKAPGVLHLPLYIQEMTDKLRDFSSSL